MNLPVKLEKKPDDYTINHFPHLCRSRVFRFVLQYFPLKYVPWYAIAGIIIIRIVHNSISPQQLFSQQLCIHKKSCFKYHLCVTLVKKIGQIENLKSV